MLAHIRSGKVTRKYNDGKGRVTLENGDTVSPPIAGYINGNDRIVPIVEETVDNSTTARTKRATVETVEPDRVLRTVTISDIPIEDIRAVTSMKKGPFVEGILTLDILKAYEAIPASRGEWPPSLDSFLAYLSPKQAASIQIEWATTDDIHRNNTFVLLLASWLDDVTPEILDTLFGIDGV
jgi:hypothetical protein